MFKVTDYAALKETFLWNYFEIGPVDQEEMPFKE